MTEGEVGRAELIFGASSGGDGGFVDEDGAVGGTDILDDRDAAGEVGSFAEAGEEEEEAKVDTVVLGALPWTGLEEVTTGSGRVGAVFTTATAREAPPPAGSRRTGAEEPLCGLCPALLTQETRNLKVPPGGRSVTL